MSAKEAKSIYMSLLETGDLWELFPSLTGDWLVDRVEFVSQYNANEAMLGLSDDFDFNDEY